MNKIVKRLIISYLLLLLPICLLSVVVVQKWFKDSRQKFESQLTYDLNKVENEFQEIYIRYKEMAVLLTSSNYELRPQNMLKDALNRRKGIEILKKYLIYGKEVEEVFLTYDTSDMIYSIRGVSSKNAYLSWYLGCSEEEKEKYLLAIQSKEEKTEYIKTATGDFLLLHFPVNLGEKNIGMSVNYKISMNYFAQKLDGFTADIPICINLSIQHNDNKLNYIKTTGEGIERATDSFAMDRIVSGTTKRDSWIDVQVKYSNRKYLWKSYAANTINIILLFINVLIASTLAYIFYKRGRLSIQQLETNISQRVVSGDNLWGGIETKIQEIIKEGDQWRVSAEKTKQELKQQIAFQIFQGMCVDQATIEQKIKVCNLELYEEYFFVFGILFEGETLNSVDEVKALLEQKLYSIVTVCGKCAVFIYEELPNYDDSKAMRKQLIERHREVFIRSGMKIDEICSSKVYHELPRVCSAYSEVAETLSQSTPHKEDSIIFSETVQISKYKPKLPKNTLEELADAIKKKDKDTIINHIQQLSNYIETNTDSTPIKRDLRFQIVNKVFTLVPKDEVEDAVIDQLMQSLLESSKEFEMSLLKVIALDYQNSKLNFNEIIHYLEKNYNRSDLSLEEVAEYSGFTKTYLSKLFKVKTGICYIDYLTDLRMNKAKELLNETDKTIKIIVEEVGYIDVSTFRRKFKAKFKYGPSEYRELRKLG